MKTQGRVGQGEDELNRIYEAALDKEAFDGLAGVLASSMKSANGVLVVRQNGVPVDLSATISAEAKQAYFAYYGRIDVWTQATAALPPYVASASEDFISDNQVLNSEFYVDYARHLEMFRPMGTKALLAPGLTLMLGVNRPQSAPKYDDSDKARILEIARHVQRALQLRRRLQAAEEHAAIGFAALQELAFGVVIAESDTRLRFVNTAAEALHRMRAGIILRGGRLGTDIVQDTSVLAALIRNAADGGPGGAMRIRRHDGQASLFALVSRLPEKLKETPGTPGLALVALQRADACAPFAEAVLSGLFGLSPAEVQITQALMRGERLESIGAARGVQMTTIKTQLESIFRKTSVESQRELVRLLGRLPQTKGLGSA